MKPKHLTMILFFSLITILPVLTLALPKNEVSELENRTLQKPPQLSAENLLNKSFMNDSEKYMTDHFMGREQAVKSKTLLELALLRREVNSVFIDKDMLLEKIGEPDKQANQNSIKAINDFAEKYNGQLNVSVAIIPTAAEIYKQNLPPFAKPLNQTDYIKSYYSKLVNTNNIDMYTKLAAESEKYIYYRTDHHWTSYGAYVGYTALAPTLGFKSISYDSYNIEHASHAFLGTLYSKAIYGENLADTVDLYTSAQKDPIQEVIKYNFNANSETKLTPISYPSIFFREHLTQKDKYATFLGGNDAVVKIKTNVVNDKRIILFKDSYSLSLMQFLPQHYSEIVLVDLRYIKLPLSEYIDINDYTDALFIYNVAGLITDTSILKVAAY